MSQHSLRAEYILCIQQLIPLTSRTTTPFVCNSEASLQIGDDAFDDEFAELFKTAPAVGPITIRSMSFTST